MNGLPGYTPSREEGASGEEAGNGPGPTVGAKEDFNLILNVLFP